MVVTHAMNTVAIVQARMGSRRLPGKMLLDLGGMPALERTLGRVRRARSVDRVVVATTALPRDRPLVDLAGRLGLACFAGDEDDVLDRYDRAAAEHGADVVVRLTGDCPLHDPDLIDEVVAAYKLRHGTLDYMSNVGPPTYPDGLDVEVFPSALLGRLRRDARDPRDREHVTTFVRSRPSEFRCANVALAGEDLSAMRWTLDGPEDLEFLRSVFAAFGGGDDFGWRDVVALLRSQPSAISHRPSAFGRQHSAVSTFHSALSTQHSAPPRLKIERSQGLWGRARGLIPGGTQTLSKGPTQYVDGAAPKYLDRGEGGHVWDVDGNEFIDYPMGLGAVSLGHGHPATREAIREQLERGIAFSLMHPLELEVAELLRAIVPCAEAVRFGKNGSDATAAAVRCARAVTGRDLIAHCGYHGWQDWYVGSVGGARARGVPGAVRALQEGFAYNDVASLERIFDDHPGAVAGVIMEVMTVEEPRAGFLEDVAALTRRRGAVLIFDEIVSGFRHRLGGLQEYFGVTPDLATIGKGMANGMPISAVVGRAGVMAEFEDIFFSTTFGGECLSLAAAKACLEFMRREPVVEHFWTQGAKLQAAYRDLAARSGLGDYTDCAGLPPWTTCRFFDRDGQDGLAMKSLFQQEMLKRGVLFSGSQFICHAHTDADVRHTIDAYDAAFALLADAVRGRRVERSLEGRPIRPVFRRQ